MSSKCSTWWLSRKEPTCLSGDTGLTPGSGIGPGRGNGNPFLPGVLATAVFLPGEIPWTVEPGGLQSMESQKSQTQLSD